MAHRPAVKTQQIEGKFNQKKTFSFLVTILRMETEITNEDSQYHNKVSQNHKFRFMSKIVVSRNGLTKNRTPSQISALKTFEFFTSYFGGCIPKFYLNRQKIFEVSNKSHQYRPG